MKKRWTYIVFVCVLVLENIGNTAKGTTDNCLISSQKSTITMYGKEGKLQERIVIRNNKVTVYDSSGKIKNRGVIRDGKIMVYDRTGAIVSRVIIEND